MTRVSVIIVNYRSADLAIKAVASLFAFPPPEIEFDVHVVENASGGDDADALRTAIDEHGWGEQVTLYVEATNHGFGRGNNIALNAVKSRATTPDYAFLLNPDAVITHDVITPLIAEMRKADDIGFAGAAVVNPGGARARAAFRFPTIASIFASAVSFGPISRLFKSSEVALPPDTPTGPVDWVAGAALMIRFDALLALDFFDPSYFLYYEEVSLMLRGQRQGWHTIHVAEAVVEHVEGASTNVKSGRRERQRLPVYLYDSWRIYFGGNHGRLYLGAATIAWVAGAAMNHVIAAILRRQPVAPARFFGDIWSIVIRPQLGLKPRYD